MILHKTKLKKGKLSRRVTSSGMLRRVAFVATYVSKELSASIIKATSQKIAIPHSHRRGNLKSYVIKLSK
jgi:predicted transcriptional regulator of viral defense system